MNKAEMAKHLRNMADELEKDVQKSVPNPEHYDGEPCDLPVHCGFVDAAKGLRFEYTGECRFSRAGEWVACISDSIRLVEGDPEYVWDARRHVLRAVPLPETRVLVFNADGTESEYSFRCKVKDIDFARIERGMYDLWDGATSIPVQDGASIVNIIAGGGLPEITVYMVCKINAEVTA